MDLTRFTKPLTEKDAKRLNKYLTAIFTWRKVLIHCFIGILRVNPQVLSFQASASKITPTLTGKSSLMFMILMRLEFFQHNQHIRTFGGSCLFSPCVSTIRKLSVSICSTSHLLVTVPRIGIPLRILWRNCGVIGLSTRTIYSFRDCFWYGEFYSRYHRRM